MTNDFVAAGWTLVSRDEITWMRSASLAEDLEKLTSHLLVFER